MSSQKVYRFAEGRFKGFQIALKLNCEGLKMVNERKGNKASVFMFDGQNSKCFSIWIISDYQDNFYELFTLLNNKHDSLSAMIHFSFDNDVIIG